MKKAPNTTPNSPAGAQHAQPGKANSPTPEQVKAHRLAHGHTQAQAAELVHMPARTWQKWEAGDNRIHPAMWELYRIKTAMQ